MTSLLSRYHVLEQLGEGSMGVVHKALDTHTGRHVALKQCLRNEGSSRNLFKQEFWALHTLQHPGLVGAFDYGESDGEAPYFTMPLVEGRDLNAPQTEEQVRAWLPQLVSVLDFLHGRGYVHGDLKPENIKIQGDGRVCLMDLGLVCRVGQVRPIAGTLLYAAPEVALGRAIDGRADLYALGAVLYELLSGTPPFEAPDTVSLLRAHVETPAPSLRQRVPGISTALETQVARLLEKSPEKRPPDGLSLLEGLGIEAGVQQEFSIVVPGLVGRDNEKREIGQRLLSASGDAVAVCGAAGYGKSRLAEEIAGELNLSGAKVLKTVAAGQETAPYKALRGALIALTDWVPSVTLAQMSPKLRHQLPELSGEAAPQLSGSAEQARFHDAITTLVESVPDPIIWVIDDYDHLDEASVSLLQFLQTRVPAAHLRWLRTAREKSANDDHVIRLERLSDPDLLAVAKGCLNGAHLPEMAAARILQHAQGCPAKVVSLLRYWVRRKALQRLSGAWTVPDSSWLVYPADTGDRHAVPELSPQALAVAEAAAVVGEQGALLDLAFVAQLHSRDLSPPLTELNRADVLKSVGAQYAFAHADIAPALAARIEPDRSRALHGRMYERLRDSHAPGLEHRLNLMHHALRAGEYQAGREEWPRLVGAASAIAALHALLPLIAWGTDARDLPDDLRAQMEATEIVIMRGRGQLDDALTRCTPELLQRLAGLDASILGEHLLVRGNLMQQKGRYEEAEAELVACLEALGHQTKSSLGVRARFTLARVRYFRGEKSEARDRLMEAISDARQLRLNDLLAGLLSLTGFVIAMSGLPQGDESGCTMLEEAITLGQQTGSLLDLMDATGNLGNVHAAAGRHTKALAAFNSYLEYCERLAIPAEAVYARLNLASTAFELAAWSVLEEHVSVAWERSCRDGRRFPEGYALALRGLWQALRGDPNAGFGDLQAAGQIATQIGNPYLGEQVHAMLAEAAFLAGGSEALQTVIAEAGGFEALALEGEQAARWMRIQAGLEAIENPQEYLDGLNSRIDQAQQMGRNDTVAHCLRWGGSAALILEKDALAVDLMRKAAEAAITGSAFGLTGEISLIAAWAAWRTGDTQGALQQIRELRKTAPQHRSTLTADLGIVLESILLAQNTPEAGAAHRRVLAWLETLPEAWRTSGAGGPEVTFILNALKSGRPESPSVDIAAPLLALSDVTDFEGALYSLTQEMGRLFAADAAHAVLWAGGEINHTAHWGSSKASGDEMRVAHDAFWTGGTVIDAEQGIRGFSVFGGPAITGAVVVTGGDGNAAKDTAAQLLAQQGGLILARQKKLDSALLEASELKVAFEAAARLVACASREEQRACLATFILSVTGGERVLWLVEEGLDLQCREAWTHEGKRLSADSQPFTHGVATWAKQKGEPLFLLDVQQEDEFRGRGSVMALGLRSVFIVPLWHQGECAGVLYVDLQHVAPDGHAQLGVLQKLGHIFSHTMG